MRNAIRRLAVLAIVSVAGVGCQSKLYTENTDLRQQNLELQQQLDEANRQKLARATLPPPAPPVQAAAPSTPAPIDPPPAPAAPTPPARPDLGNLEVTHDTAAGTTTVNLPSDISFASGAAVLLPEAKKSLAKVITALKKEYSAKPVRILGNTDSDPIIKSHWKSNQELSERRAEAVRDYLVSKGIPADRITTEGLGDTNPKSKNDKAKNRRVELVVLTR